MSLAQTLNNIFSPLLSADKPAWRDFLANVGDDFIFVPDARYLINHLALLTCDDITGKDLPGLFIHTDPFVKDLHTLFLRNITMNIQNRGLRIEEVVDLRITNPLEINPDFYNDEWKRNIRILTEQVEIPENEAGEGNGISNILRPKPIEKIRSDFYEERFFGAARLYKFTVINNTQGEETEFERYLLYIFHDKVSVMKRLVLEEGLKMRHIAVLRPKLSYNLFSNRLFELFFGIMGTEFYYFDERFDQDPDYTLLQTDPQLYEAYRDPRNLRCMHSIYNYITVEMQEGDFVDFCQVLRVKPVITD